MNTLVIGNTASKGQTYVVQPGIGSGVSTWETRKLVGLMRKTKPTCGSLSFSAVGSSDPFSVSQSILPFEMMSTDFEFFAHVISVSVWVCKYSVHPYFCSTATAH